MRAFLVKYGFAALLVSAVAELSYGQAATTRPYTTQARAEITGLPPAPLVPHTPDDLRAIQARVEAVVKAVLPATVCLSVGEGEGSGIIVSRDGYILTAGHVSGTPGSRVAVVMPDGRSPEGRMPYPDARSLGANREIDSGMIKITNPPADLPFVPLGTAASLSTGQWVVALGHPLGLQAGRPPVVRLGRVLEISNGVRAFVGTDCELVMGDSGGPVFDLDGRVVAINSRISSDEEDNRHVPIDTFVDTWDRLAKGDQWGLGTIDPLTSTKAIKTAAAPARPRLGLNIADSAGGVTINGIAAGTPAEDSDLRVGDIIAKADGKALKFSDDLISIVGLHKPGDSLALELIRDAKRKVVNVVLAAGAAMAANQPDAARTKSSDALRSVFNQAAQVNRSTVAIVAMDQGTSRQVALGTVVSADGYILTKSSEVLGQQKVQVILPAGRFDAKVVGVREREDLLMLKVEATGLKPVVWADTTPPYVPPTPVRGNRGATPSPAAAAAAHPNALKIDVGEWIATAAPGVQSTSSPLAVGVIGVGRRAIPPVLGYFGARYLDAGAGQGARVRSVDRNSPADEAGIELGDVITAINNVAVRSSMDLARALGALRPGDAITFSVQRAGDALTLRFALSAIADQEVQVVTGDISRRSSDFAAVYQHDAVIQPADCGGPVADLDGRVLGINIARAGRTETYTLPADIIVPLIEPLKSGKLAPVGPVKP